MRWSILLVAALVSCRGKHHESMTSPVKGLLHEVAAGTGLLAPFRAYFTPEVPDREIMESRDLLKKAIRAYGREARFEVEGENQVRVRFSENASFVARVNERWSGWWITSIDLTDLEVPVEEPKMPGSWWTRGGS